MLTSCSGRRVLACWQDTLFRPFAFGRQRRVRPRRSRAYLKANEQLHTLDTLSVGSCESGGCEGPRSGGEDTQATPDIVVISRVCVVLCGRLVHQG